MSSLDNLFIKEDDVMKYLNWDIVCEAVEQSMISVVNDGKSENLPNSSQPARTFTFTNDKSGVLLSMPGFLGNYKLPSIDKDKIYNTLGCKLVTSFDENLNINLPKILGTIFLFDEKTGKLKCTVEGTKITEWRTAAASLISTKFLYFNRLPENLEKSQILAIIGCGVQGRIHAIGFLSQFHFKEIHLYNRTIRKAELLKLELEDYIKDSEKSNITIKVYETIKDCVEDADVIVTSTFSSEPLIYSSQIKENCHINAIGAGVNHYTELSPELYKKVKVYIDSWANAEVELKGLDADIVGQVGDVITNKKPTPSSGRTVFQSMGMAVEDAVVAEMIYQKYIQESK